MESSDIHFSIRFGDCYYRTKDDNNLIWKCITLFRFTPDDDLVNYYTYKEKVVDTIAQKIKELTNNDMPTERDNHKAKTLT